ncbi:malignant fibrous histiocytoma-amplified sequence 1 homolog [Ostrea edulis]|uniref:malignant fibrous histiocytoma-amplified sequence 1 homolog n=1 Tax=Ostrea edulis TaxID=37623 RepID=UPI0024AEA73C|nr:malignant fibrous histiocytoma-amplified sequence 1 homolog [Ostrea edulis]XP_048763592.2 malignant fibrous histiocytoma-amplified sequence 1 homolog [Ostrea edulis]XP_048763593.2 malignant fibrous histiocytoma-amplified sequence 1 homolog [Ostrea edulis]XP_056020240.1 malignant fibrous histiocytoma-amplified sequence 1 homolog [Ostrea edulis]
MPYTHYIYTPRSTSDIKTFRLRIDTEDPLFRGKKKLKLTGRELSDIPKVIFQLHELEILDLSPERQSCLNFKLLAVPPGICRLTNLTVLILDTNELTELPEEICQLVDLESMALSNNLLDHLPKGFDNLQKLRSLHMANNLFEVFPKELCQLENLEFLDMSDNKLTVLPVSISNMKNLHTLLLFLNNLSKLPDSLCEMTELYCLWIGNNNISRLPQNFGNLKNLDWNERYTSSVLDGNPLTYPPLEICRQGVRAIDRFLRTSNLNGGQKLVDDTTWEKTEEDEAD